MDIFNLNVLAIIIYCYIFIIGLCLGSFFMVVGFRVARKETLMGRSHCETCHEPLKTRQLIPVLSYLFLQGKCAQCGMKIGVTAPLYETLTGVLFVLTVHQFGYTLETIVGVTMLSLLLIISVSDIKYRLIPNKILFFFLAIGIIERIIVPQNSFWWFPIAGFLAGFLPLYILSIIMEKSVGGGDIKLLAVLGIYIGPINILVSLFLSSVIALLYAVAAMFFNKKMQRYVPFGPFIGIGTMIVYFLSENFLN